MLEPLKITIQKDLLRVLLGRKAIMIPNNNVSLLITNEATRLGFLSSIKRKDYQDRYIVCGKGIAVKRTDNGRIAFEYNWRVCKVTARVYIEVCSHPMEYDATKQWKERLKIALKNN